MPNFVMADLQINNPETLKRSAYFITTGNGDNILIDGDSIIKRSFTPASTPAVFTTDTVGIKAAIVFRFAMQKYDIAADVFSRLKWEIAAASAGVPQGRLNLDIQQNGVAIPGLVKALGPVRSLSAPVSTPYEELLHVLIPFTRFALGNQLDFVVEFEVTTASGSGGSTGQVKFHHDPASFGNEAIVEVNV